MFPERETSFVLWFAGILIHLTVHVGKKSWLIAGCSGFPIHNFLTCSDSQKFRVSAYS